MINIHFNIASQDQSQSQMVIQKLGGTRFDDINFEVDQESSRKLAHLLPLTVNLYFNDNGVKFDGDEKSVLVSSLPRDQYNLATGSASFQFQNGDSLNLTARDPETLINYATRSGQFQASSKLSPVLEVLGKIDTIDMTVNNGKMSGEILLK